MINFFEQSGMVDKSKISIQGLEFYYQFKNKYYGKNNLFVNTDEHKAMLRFLISMLENQKNILEAKVEMMKGGNVSLDVYLNEIREKISVLDNMLHFAL